MAERAMRPSQVDAAGRASREASRCATWGVIVFVCAFSLLAAGCGSSHSAAEKHVVFTRPTTANHPMIWIADANGRHARRLSRGYAAVVSPDGRTIAVGRPHGLYLVSSDGKSTRRLTSKNYWPEAWSPDGRWIIGETDSALAVVDAGSGRRYVVARGNFFGFDLSPDGRRLVYARAARTTPETPDLCDTKTDLYVVDLSGGRPTQLTRDGRSSYPVWGPRRIAFARLPKRQPLYSQPHIRDCFAAGIWTRRPDGSGLGAVVARAPRAFSHFGYAGLQPVAWLPNGNLLVGLRTEWRLEAAVLETRSRQLRRLGLYADEASGESRYVLGSGGNDKVTISIIRVRDGRRIFVLRGDVCCPDWNR